MLVFENLTVLSLLHDFDLACLLVLLFLHLTSLFGGHELVVFQSHFLVFLQMMLVHLVVKNASVRVLQFRLVHQLLLELLLGMQLTSLVLMDFICLFLLLLLLLGHREGAHVLRINLILLIYSSFLGGQVSLLVYVEWVIRYFRVYAFTMRATST